MKAEQNADAKSPQKGKRGGKKVVKEDENAVTDEPNDDHVDESAGPDESGSKHHSQHPKKKPAADVNDPAKWDAVRRDCVSKGLNSLQNGIYRGRKGKVDFKACVTNAVPRCYGHIYPSAQNCSFEWAS